MSHLRIPQDYWSCAMLPEGVLERWCVADGATVHRGQALAQVRVEDALHDLLSPAAGRLRVGCDAGVVVDPGMEIGRIEP